MLRSGELFAIGRSSLDQFWHTGGLANGPEIGPDSLQRLKDLGIGHVRQRLVLDAQF
jgi:hypothetical protein